jgi:hypothetical protein
MPEPPKGAIDVPTTPVTSKPPTLPQSVLDVQVLVNSSGNCVPSFQQNDYQDLVPVQNAKNSRTIASAGCGLCAWASLLAAAGCLVPVFDPDTKTFSAPAAGAATVDPRTLLQYFVNYSLSQTKTAAEAKSWAATHLFEPANAGVVLNKSPDVKAAVDKLVTLSNPSATARLDNTVSNVGTKTGSDLPQVTAGLKAGNPSLLVVCFPGTDCSGGGDHQVLAVGIAKIDKSTYYVVTDSGFPTYDPLPALKSGGYVTTGTLYSCLAGKKAKTYVSFYRYRVLGGLQPLTGFQLKPLFP